MQDHDDCIDTIGRFREALRALAAAAQREVDRYTLPASDYYARHDVRFTAKEAYRSEGDVVNGMLADALALAAPLLPPPAPERAHAFECADDRCARLATPCRYQGHICRHCQTRLSNPVHAAPENAKCRRCGAAHPWCGNPDHVYGCDCGSRNCPGPAPEKVGEGEKGHHFECANQHLEAIKETAICIARDHRCRHCNGYRLVPAHCVTGHGYVRHTDDNDPYGFRIGTCADCGLERAAHRDGKEK
jgi:hypothetical protein